MAVTMVLGCDPGLGPTSGLCLLQLEPMAPGGPPVITSRLVFSCNSDAVFGLVEHLLESNEGPARVIAAGERFVAGRGAGARGHGAAVARDVIADLTSLHGGWHWRSASDVKLWATDTRLKAAGLYEMTAKMTDARDAARHALFAAVHDAGLPDPLIAARKRARVVVIPDSLDGAWDN